VAEEFDGEQFVDAGEGRDGVTLKPEALFRGGMLRYVTGIGNSVMELAKNVEIFVACDVENPLLGVKGSVRVFGKQKGLLEENFEEFEQGIANVNTILQRDLGAPDWSNFPMAGAAGGLSGMIHAALGGKMTSGMDFIEQYGNLHALIDKSDVIVTGEGGFDNQTFDGKVIHIMLKLAHEGNKQVVIICGINRVPQEVLDREDVAPLLQKAKILEMSKIFGMDKSLHQSEECLKNLVKDHFDDVFTIPVSKI